MAPLSDTSIRNLSGTWEMDKTRSTDLDAVFKLVGQPITGMLSSQPRKASKGWAG
ncbi:hypothetical protein BDV24DRAFT_121795 [Aspergillus arachidicola]|uniref:Uncharacterized protein n=1 Tax=Aspergillus arachidicola TaxID=656916 RepID=A0A5N6YPA5_9EURO|nr:hypothetical protein BDV24DRAFT_121795 [Aspergillus arachidicola]